MYSRPQPWKNLLINSGLIILLGLNVISWYGVNYFAASRLEIHFLDIGQGDAFLIKTPDKVTMLVDTGKPGTGVKKVNEALLPWERIDVFMASHPDADHIGDMPAIMSKWQPDFLLFNNLQTENGGGEKLNEAEVERGNWQLLDGDKLRLGCCVVIDIIWPQVLSPKLDDTHDTNYFSLAFVLVYGDFRMFAGGDIPTEVEDKLIDQRKLVGPIDLLKVSHHGSNTSSGIDFLRKLRPTVSVIQTGENSYGHPRPEVLANLNQVGSRVLRNDQHGRIIYRTNGYDFNISTTKTP